MQRWSALIDQNIVEAKIQFNPPKKLSVSEWADENRVLSISESPLGGKWKTSNTPYLKKIMDCFSDLTTEVVTFLKPSQVGATEVGINICAFTVDQEPARLLYVMPDEELAKDFSVDRLQKALKMTPSIDSKLQAGGGSKALALRYPGGFIRLTGAQSPAKLASWAIPRVVMDEVDKYPRWTGREASPIKLVQERTKNFPWKKLMIMSTPTTEAGNVYQAYEKSDVKYKYYVPCPDCGHWQTLEFEHVKIPKEPDGKYNLLRVRNETYYQCPACHFHIRDKHKKEMLRRGRWIPLEEIKYTPKKVGFALNSLYSPFVTFGDVAKEFVESKDDASLLMNFVNSWLGEPWRSKASKIEISAVMNQRATLASGIVPRWAQILTGGVDVQQGYFYWVIRAWGAGMRSRKIACGQCNTFGDLQNIMDIYWPIENNDYRKMQVMAYCIDSGYDTENVYDFCYDNLNIAYPVKGSSQPMTMKFKISPTEPTDKRRQGHLNRYVVDTDQYKNWIVAHMNIPVGEAGAWEVDADTTETYAEMICSEHKVVETEGRYPVERWVKISSARPNHFLDCEVYAAVAGDILQVRYLQEQDESASDDDASEFEMLPKNFKPY